MTLNTSGASLSGVLSGDAGNVTLVTSGATGTFANKNVANGITVTVSGLSLSGSAAVNYQLLIPQETTTANITSRSTSTSVTFGTNPDVVGQPTTVTVTVIDTAGAGASNPGGTASFTPTGHGSFTGTCTLTQGGAQ